MYFYKELLTLFFYVGLIFLAIQPPKSINSNCTFEENMDFIWLKIKAQENKLFKITIPSQKPLWFQKVAW